MTAVARQGRAAFLALVGAHGLFVAALVHSEEHLREQREDRAEAAAAQEAWQAASGDPAEALAFALAHPHQRRDPRPARHHHHSHGPAGPGRHGSGTLSHLALALCAAPAVPRIEAPSPDHAAPRPVVAQLHATLRHLIPERAQGPPASR